MKKIVIACSILFLLITSTSVIFASKEEVKKDVIGISKIVAHPALDAVEQGIQDELADLGYDLEYDLQNANGEVSTAASIANSVISFTYFWSLIRIALSDVFFNSDKSNSHNENRISKFKKTSGSFFNRAASFSTFFSITA